MVIKAFKHISEHPRCAVTQAPGTAMIAISQKPSGGTGNVDVAHPPGNHRGNQEIILQKLRERVANPVFVFGDDRGVRNWQAKRVPEKRRDGKPVCQPADHRGFGKGLDEGNRRMKV